MTNEREPDIILTRDFLGTPDNPVLLNNPIDYMRKFDRVLMEEDQGRWKTFFANKDFMALLADKHKPLGFILKQDDNIVPINDGKRIIYPAKAGCINLVKEKMVSPTDFIDETGLFNNKAYHEYENMRTDYLLRQPLKLYVEGWYYIA